jgi:hypothetical protein
VQRVISDIFKKKLDFSTRKSYAAHTMDIKNNKSIEENNQEIAMAAQGIAQMAGFGVPANQIQHPAFNNVNQVVQPHILGGAPDTLVMRKLSDLEVERMLEGSLAAHPDAVDRPLPANVACISGVYYKSDEPSNTPAPAPRPVPAPVAPKHVAPPPLPAPKHANAVPYPIPAPAPSQADVEVQRSQNAVNEVIKSYAKMLSKREISGPIEFLCRVFKDSDLPASFSSHSEIDIRTAMLQIVNDRIKNKSVEELVKITLDSEAKCDQMLGWRRGSLKQEIIKSTAYELLSYMLFEVSKRVSNGKGVLNRVDKFGSCVISTFLNAAALESMDAVRKNPDYNAVPVLTARANQLLAKRGTLPLHTKQIECICQMIMDTVKLGGNFALSQADICLFAIGYGVEV